MTDEQIEQEIQEKGLTAPRVTLSDIEAAIVSEHYFTAASANPVVRAGAHSLQKFPHGLLHEQALPDCLNRLTFCVLVLRNGYTVTGECACVSPENFDAELGHKIARQNAIDKCWPLFGFALADRLHHHPETNDGR